MDVRCRFCGTSLRHTFCDLGTSPLANSFVTDGGLSAPESHYPLHVRVCDSCLLVQLPAAVTPEVLFSDYAYFSSYSTSWLEHCRRYAAMVTERFGLGRSSRVVEVASNDGYLLQYFRRSGVPVLGIEPAGNVAAVAQAAGIETHVEFFGSSVAEKLRAAGRQADLLIGNNVFAHVPDLNDFVAGLKIALKPQGVITLEFPHLLRLIDENQFDTIYHEHVSYFSMQSARRVLAAHDLHVFDVEELTTHGGSLRLFASHREVAQAMQTSRVDELVRCERSFGLERLETYLRFSLIPPEIKRALLRFLINARDAGKTVCGYGAPAKGNTLLNYCGVRTDMVDFTVDANPHKQYRHLPGSRIPVFPPDKIFEARPDYVLILPWNLRAEILAQLKPAHEWGCRFVVAIPELSVIT